MKSLKRGESQVDPETLYCDYCSIYRKSKDRDKKKLTRYCRPNRKNVRGGDKGCKHFRPSKYFWCDGEEMWLSLRQCEARREPGGLKERASNVACHKCKRQHFQVDRVVKFSQDNFANIKVKPLTLKRTGKKLKKLNKNKPQRKLKKLRR